MSAVAFIFLEASASSIKDPMLNITASKAHDGHKLRTTMKVSKKLGVEDWVESADGVEEDFPSRAQAF